MNDSGDTDQLLQQVALGDASAGAVLLDRYRDRLLRMVAVRMDHRLQSRVDPSDVVQDAMVTAHGRLGEFAQQRPMHFYAWLRQLTTDRLIDLHRHHLQADRRTVIREIEDASTWQLAKFLADSELTPLRHLLHEELCARVRNALKNSSDAAREVLLLRFVEQLSIRECADVLGISETALKSRQLRALQSLGQLLEKDDTQ